MFASACLSACPETHRTCSSCRSAAPLFFVPCEARVDARILVGWHRQVCSTCGTQIAFRRRRASSRCNRNSDRWNIASIRTKAVHHRNGTPSIELARSGAHGSISLHMTGFDISGECDLGRFRPGPRRLFRRPASTPRRTSGDSEGSLDGANGGHRSFDSPVDGDRQRVWSAVALSAGHRRRLLSST
jgi:hypothetical protein